MYPYRDHMTAGLARGDWMNGGTGTLRSSRLSFLSSPDTVTPCNRAAPPHLVPVSLLRWLLLLFCLPTGMMLTSPPDCAASNNSIGLLHGQVLGVWTHMVAIDLNDPTVKVSVELAAGFPGHDEPFLSMVRRSGADAAITGTFFSTTSLFPIGDIVVDGRMRYAGGIGSAIALTPDNRVAFRRVPYGRLQDWTGYETVLAAGPTLITDGRVDLLPARERFGDPGVLGRAARAVVGVRRNNKLLFITVRQPVTLKEIARIAERAGCVHAINLDGGSSTALYYRGALILPPQRRLVNILVAQTGVSQALRYAGGGVSLWGSLHRNKRMSIAAWKYQVGEASAGKGHWPEAIESLRLAARLAPDNASYHLSHARALNAVGRQAARATALAEAGKAYARKGLTKDAAVQLRRSLHLNPNDIPTRRQYAEILASLGRAADSERQEFIAEFGQLSMATPLIKDSSAQSLSRAVLYPPSPGFRQVIPSPRTHKPSTGQLSVSTRTTSRRKWDFRLQLRGQWEYSQDRAETIIRLQDRRRRLSGVLRVFPLSPTVTVAAFRQQYHARQFHACERSIAFNRDGAIGIEDECRSVVAGVELIHRCVYVRQENYILAMTLSADASRHRDVNDEFSRIMGSLRFSR